MARRGARGPSRRGRVGARAAVRRRARLPAPPARRAAPVGRRRRSCWPATPRRAARRPACRPTSTPPTTVQRVTRTDARVICCGHTHVADVRELGRKLIVNPGSCGYAFDGDPDACWALLTLATASEPDGRAAPRRLRCAGGGRGGQRSAACPATSTGPPPSARGGSCDERVARRARGRRHRAWARSRRWAAAWPSSGGASWRASRASAPSRSSTPSGLPSRIAGEVPDFDPSGVLDRKEIRRNDRTTQMALVATREAMDDAGLPARLEGEPGRADGHPHRLRAGRHGHAHRPDRHRHATGGPTALSPFFIPMAIANMAAGVAAISLRRHGPQLLDHERLRHVRPRHRRGARDHPARRRRDDVRGRLRGVRLRGDRRRLRGHARPVHPQRRPGRRQPALRQRPRRLRPRRGRRDARPRGARPRPGARRAHPRRGLRLRRHGRRHHITSPAPGGAGAVRAARRALERPAWSTSASTSSRAHATSTRRGRHEGAGGHQLAARRPCARRSASRPPRRPSATPWAPPAPSPPWPPC